MMFYIDTNVILSYTFTNEANHLSAVNAINGIKSKGKFYISSLVVSELYCNIVRNISKYALPYSGFRNLAVEVKARIIIEYAMRTIGIDLQPDDGMLERLWLGEMAFWAFSDSIDLDAEIGLRTGDAIHLAYANKLKKNGLVQYIVSLDKDFGNKRNEIRMKTGIEILPNTA